MLGTDGSGGIAPEGSAITVADIWATYQINSASSVAAEEIYKDGGIGNKGSNSLIYYKYNITSNHSTWFSMSGENFSDGGPSYTKYSISPTYALNNNLTVRAHYSYTKYTNYTENSANFVGAEVLFKF